MHQHAPGCPARARLDRRLRDAVSRTGCSAAGHRSLPNTGRHMLTPQRLQVSCPAVEQDTELPSSGRAHNDSDLIHALFQTEQPTLVEDVAAELDYAARLNKRVLAASSLPLLCDLVQQEAPQFDYLTTSHALYRLSILCHAYFTQLQSAHLTSREAQQAAWIEYVEPALQTLGQLLIRHMDELDAWGVAISFWAYGKLQCSDEAAFAALCERGLAIMDEFNAVDCASTLVGIARLRVRPRCQREFLEHLLAHTADLLSHVDAWSSQEVANVLWGLSKIGAAGPSRRSLLEGLLEMTLWRLEEFSVQQLAIVVYSCGRMRLRLPQQLAKITHHIAVQAQNMNPLDAAHVMWGCAKVDFTPGATLLERLPGVMVPRLSEFKPQEVCMLLYGYGHLRQCSPVLLEGVAAACSSRLHEFSSQDLCVTLWSYGMVQYSPADTTLFDNACRVLLSRANRLLPLELTMAIKGFARAGYQPPPEFMRQVAQLAMQKLHQFSPMEYSQLLWAYAALGYRDVALFEAVVGHTINALQTWTRRLPKTTVDTIIWSCERVGFWPQSLVDTAEMRGVFVKTGSRGAAAHEEMEVISGLPQQTDGSSDEEDEDSSSSSSSLGVEAGAAESSSSSSGGLNGFGDQLGAMHSAAALTAPSTV
ncbi:hypothetical protein OEZ86_000514 [Tetradesmus obliquus]|nr:hypothetical protein OEZ86_000514 [Tetradesmus obliquus]